MKTIRTQFEEHLWGASTIFKNEDIVSFQYLDFISSISADSYYVIDVRKKRFCHIQPDARFLCGHSVGEAMSMGTDFYQEIIHPDDLPLWRKMFKAVLLYLNHFEEKQNEINYFSCTFRLQRKYSFLAHSLSQMINHQMKPVWKEDELRYFICSVESSATKKAGNLRMYYKDGLAYEEYSTATERWKKKTIVPLTEHERAILMLARQGKSSGEIAGDLCKGCNTIRNQIKALFSKLNVHTMQEALEFAHHHILNLKQKQQQQPVETLRKRARIPLTADKIQCIQQHLDDGKSIRQAAKLEGITEGTIRYLIKHGKLKESNRDNHQHQK
jgi:DNA-binding NarL/FixJ family response regulator